MKIGDIYWRRYKTQETLYIGKWCLSPLQSRHLGTSHSSPNCHQLPCNIFLNLTDCLKSLVLGKARSLRAPNLGYRGLSHLGDLMFHKKTLHRMWCVSGHIAMIKLPITGCHSCGLLNNLNSFCRGMFKLNAKFDADLLLYLLSHFECDGHTVHMPIQWCLPSPLTSTVKLSLFIHAQSSPHCLAARLQGCDTNRCHYINNGWTFSGQTSILFYIGIWRSI